MYKNIEIMFKIYFSSLSIIFTNDIEKLFYILLEVDEKIIIS